MADSAADDLPALSTAADQCDGPDIALMDVSNRTEIFMSQKNGVDCADLISSDRDSEDVCTRINEKVVETPLSLENAEVSGIVIRFRLSVNWK